MADLGAIGTAQSCLNQTETRLDLTSVNVGPYITTRLSVTDAFPCLQSSPTTGPDLRPDGISGRVLDNGVAVANAVVLLLAKKQWGLSGVGGISATTGNYLLHLPSPVRYQKTGSNGQFSFPQLKEIYDYADHYLLIAINPLTAPTNNRAVGAVVTALPYEVELDFEQAAEQEAWSMFFLLN